MPILGSTDYTDDLRLAHVLADGDVVEPVTAESPDGLSVLRHSAAHVLAQAVQEVDPAAPLGLGPPIRDGFYYDFDVETPFNPQDLKALEKDEKAQGDGVDSALTEVPEVMQTLLSAPYVFGEAMLAVAVEEGGDGAVDELFDAPPTTEEHQLDPWTLIADHAVAGDVAVTADIPLAAILVPNGVVVIDPRGEVYTADSIGERLSVRNFMEGLRGAGVETGGHGAYGPREKQAFSNALDRALTRAMRSR